MKNTLFLVLSLFVFVGLAFAGPVCVDIPPMTVPSPQICATAPGLGDVIILPGMADFIAEVWWEDLDARKGTSNFGLPGDGDYDDAKIAILGDWATRQMRMFWASPNLDLAVYLNTISPVGYETQGISRESDAPYGVLLYAPWIPGQELVLQDRVTYNSLGVNNTWYTGGGERNADGKPHAVVKMLTIPVEETENPPEPSPVPEPATFLLIGGGLVATALFSRRKNRV